MLSIIDEVHHEQNLTVYTERYVLPFEHQHRNGSLDEPFYLELFRQALVEQTDRRFGWSSGHAQLSDAEFRWDTYEQTVELTS